MKNSMFKLGLMALIMVVLTMSVISGTLAKYVDEFKGSDSARVAKFAYEVAGLDKTNNTINVFETVADDGIVHHNDTSKLIAPGTNGSFEVSLTNKSEVLVKANYTFEETNEGNVPVVYEYNGLYYSKVLPENAEVKLHDGDVEKVKISGDLSTLSTAIGSTTEVDYDQTKTILINWAWPFEGDQSTQTDVTDTTLGSKGTDTVTVNVQCNIEQVDE